MFNIFKWLNACFDTLLPYSHIKYNYISTDLNYGHNSGWVIIKHPPTWVSGNLLHAPDYYPTQGVHYFPYCRGRHFEYFYDGKNSYRRKLHKRISHHK